MEGNLIVPFSNGAHPPLKCDSRGNLRILIVGNSGVGKSTMGRRLASILQLPIMYLDQVRWQPHWRETPDDEFRTRVESFSREDSSWIIDGNYKSLVGDLTFARATCILWLDPPFALYFPRLIIRTFQRFIGVRPPCSPGCSETMAEIFSWGEQSIIWWTWTNHTPQREFCMGQMLQPGDDQGGKWIRLGGWGKEVNAWLKQVELFAKTQ